MNLESFTGPGSTPSRRRFWDKVTAAVIASQKLAGKNVTVDEHQGYGSIISVNPQRQGGVTPTTDCPASITFSGIEFCCSCNLPEGAQALQYHEEIVDDVNYHLNGTFSLPGGDTGCAGCLNDADSSLMCRVSDNSDCPSGSETQFPVPMEIYASRLSGIWYVLVFSAFFNSIFFSGSSAGTTISNDLSDCSPTPSGGDTFDNPLIECVFGIPLNSCAAGKNGTATLGFA